MWLMNLRWGNVKIWKCGGESEKGSSIRKFKNNSSLEKVQVKFCYDNVIDGYVATINSAINVGRRR